MTMTRTGWEKISPSVLCAGGKWSPRAPVCDRVFVCISCDGKYGSEWKIPLFYFFFANRPKCTLAFLTPFHIRTPACNHKVISLPKIHLR